MAVGKSGLRFALTQNIKKFANLTRTFLNSKSLSRPLNDLKSGFLLCNLSSYGYMESLEHIFGNSHFLRWHDLNWPLGAPLMITSFFFIKSQSGHMAGKTVKGIKKKSRTSQVALITWLLYIIMLVILSHNHVM